MNLLVTGGTGFIGLALVEQLLAQGHQLWILSRDPERAARNAQANCHFLPLDYDLHQLTDIEAVINLAGEPIIGKRWSHQQKRQLCESRWQITARIARWIEESENPPHTLISGSAVGWYGAQGSEPVDEMTQVKSRDFTHELCSRWEQLALSAQSAGCRIVIVRTGIVIGNGGFLARLLPLFRAGLGGVIGSGEQYLSWVSLEDEVRAILFLLEQRSCEGIYNLTAPNPVTNREFTAQLSLQLNRPAWLNVPAFALKLLLGEAATIVLEGQNVRSRRLEEAGFTFTHSELASALAATL